METTNNNSVESVQDMTWAEGVPLMAGQYMMGLAEPSPETKDYWQGVKEGRLFIKQCSGCGKHNHPRRIFCTACNSDALESVEAKGTGTVYTFSTVYRAPVPAFEKEIPYSVGVLELSEGIYLFSRIIPEKGKEVRIGAPVQLTFQETGPNGRLPAFQIVG